MVSRPIVEVPAALADRCAAYAIQTVADYDAGLNAASRAVSSHGAERSVEIQMLGKLAECAFCIWAGLDPDIALNWSRRCDSGFDVLYAGVRFDIKASRGNGRYLIWPIRKNGIFHEKHFDALAFVKVDRPICELAGWCTKQRFAAEHDVACAGHKLDAGTWFMPESTLCRFDRTKWGDPI